MDRPDLLASELAALAHRTDLRWPSAHTLAQSATHQMSDGHLAAALSLADLAVRAGASGGGLTRVRVEAGDRLAQLDQPWRAPERAAVPSVETRPDALLAVLSQSLPLRSGGYATRSHGILTGLAGQGWHIEALTRLGFPYDRWPASDTRTVPTVDVVDGIPYHRALDDRRRYPQHPFATYTEQQAAHVTRAIERHRPALVQASSFYSAGAGAAVAARRAGLPFVYEMRGLGDLMVTANRPQLHGTQGWRYLVEMETAVCLAADGVLTLTGALREEMIRRGVPAERIGVLPNGVHADQFAPLERDTELAAELGVTDKVVLGYAGTLVEYEGLDLLLEALARMRRRSDVALVVVGDGPAEAALRTLSSSLGLDDQVTFVGRVPHTQVPRYLSLTDIAPFPRLPLDVCRLISPMKPFESMAMGRAVVSSDVAALAEIVDDGRTGRTFTAGTRVRSRTCSTSSSTTPRSATGSARPHASGCESSGTGRCSRPVRTAPTARCSRGSRSRRDARRPTGRSHTCPGPFGRGMPGRVHYRRHRSRRAPLPRACASCPGEGRPRPAPRLLVREEPLMATSRPAPGARTIVRSVLDRLPFEVSRRRPTRSASSPSDASAARLDQTRAELRQMVHAYRGLVAASQGVQASDLGPVPLAAPDASTRLANRRAVQALRRDAELVRAIERGSDLPEAAVAYVRALLKRPEAEHAQVRSFAHALQRDEATAVVGRLCEAVVASAKGLEELARARFAQVPAELWGRHALVEHVSVAGRLGDDAMIDDAVAAARVPGAPVHGVLHVAEVCLATGRLDVARELLDVVAAHEVGDEEVDRRVRWLRPWLAPVATPEPSPEGVIALGVIDYKQPDLRNTSSNLGDYVQTAAAFGHWLRHTNLTITGDEPDLVDAVTQMHGRVREDLRLDTPARTVRLVRVDRDASHHNPIPDATWTIAFGWYMHGQFGTGYDFPFHENVRPIFVSFHCNRRDMLTPEAVEYLKAHGPIGCRDWNTVYLLLSMGVPAFFSGCLTTTIDAYYEPVTAPPAASRPPVWVDVPAPAGGAYITQASDDVRWTAAGPNLIDALDLLERYRSEFGTVVTSRLHCFLPAWAIGADVDFQPHNRADVRFAGLLDADEDGRKAIQSRIRRLLEAVTTRILAGDDEATVRAAWAELCAPEIEIARARLAEPAAAHALSFDLAAACATVRSGSATCPRAHLARARSWTSRSRWTATSRRSSRSS